MSRLGRLAAWSWKMFPPFVLVPWGVAHFLAIHFSLQACAGRASLLLTWRMVCGAATVVLFSLLMRVYDELKDAQTDFALGKAGDPRYKDRPIVKGEITREDLVTLRWVVTALLLAVNLPLGWPLPLAAFLVLFALGWLSFHWFFCPAVSRDLLLALVTHNPVSLAVGAYVAAVYAAENGREALTFWTVPLLVGMWLPIAVWEVSRKVRAPEEETEYETYTRRLGVLCAPLVALVFLLFSAGCVTAVAKHVGLGPIFIACLHGSGGLFAYHCLRFLLDPSPRRSRLRPWAELYVLVANAGLAVALAARLGVRA